MKYHYEIEKRLAERLRSAAKSERSALYRACYDELFRSVPDHPQISRKSTPGERRREIEPQLRKLRRLCSSETTYLEIGAGDCAVALALAPQIRQAYAVEISPEILANLDGVPNIRTVTSDGTSIPVVPGCVDLAYSYQLLEHLHPDDILDHLRNVAAALRAGGCYYCVTPSRLTGPHDISGYFEETATGFHLWEYAYADLTELLRAAGFSKISPLLGIRGGRILMRIPLRFMIALERTFEALPRWVRGRIRKHRLVQSLLGVELLAQR